MNFVRLLSAKIRDISACIVYLNPGIRLKTRSRNSGIYVQRDTSKYGRGTNYFLFIRDWGQYSVLSLYGGQ